MLRRIVSNQQGMALVLTLLAVSFLVALTVQLALRVDWQLQAAANLSANVQAEAMLLGGLNLARAALLTDQKANDYDGPHDGWAVLDPEATEELFAPGTVSIQVEDLSGRLQINALVPEQQASTGGGRRPGPAGQQQADPAAALRDAWLRLLTSGRFAVEDEEQARALLDALLDWLDKDDDERPAGAEDSYYGSLDPPYKCGNGPLLRVEELLLVRGWSKTLLYGDQEHPGLIGFITTAPGDGTVNINTAPEPVIQALAPGLSEEMVTDLVDFRKEEENAELLSSPNWYKQVVPGDIDLNRDKLLTVKSSAFLVTVTVKSDTLQKTGKGVVIREEQGGQVLRSWQVQ